MDLVALREPLHAICQQAAQAILPVYEAHRRGKGEVAWKQDRSPVTAADHAAHAVIERELLQQFPEIPVVSEEGNVQALGDARHWLVDPLDGTKEFLAANGQFTVNIALVEGGRPVFGIVLAPATGEAYAGVPGQGAWQRGDDAWMPIRCAPLAGKVCRAVVSRSHLDERTQAFLEALRGRGLDVEPTQVGSSLKLCQVAAGGADVYPRLAPTMHWDTAAAHAVVEAAGGSVVDLEGRPLRYGHGELRNPSFIVGVPAPWPWHELAIDGSARSRPA